jgi:PhzF family phenazine biosynthesis protein
MEAPLYFFKVFTQHAQLGNPAACALLTEWPESTLLQHIASEAQQVVTAFVVPSTEDPYRYQIRWFSCQQEINLCGHGTLAAAALLRQVKGEGCYSFVSPYGEPEVTVRADALVMQLPQWHANPVQWPAALASAQIIEAFQTRDLVLVLADEDAVRKFQPDVEQIRRLPQHALIVTAFCPPDTYVLRYFAPAIGIEEDIATGSAQCSLAPYWQAKTGLSSFNVLQLSATAANFAVAFHSNQLYLKTQAVALPHLTQLAATIA